MELTFSTFDAFLKELCNITQEEFEIILDSDEIETSFIRIEMWNHYKRAPIPFYLSQTSKTQELIFEILTEKAIES